MTVTLDTELLYLAKHYQIGTQRVNKSAYKGIEKFSDDPIIEINNTDDLIKLLKLAKPKNRFAILLKLGISDLSSLMYLMDKNDLVKGLNFFTKERLMKYLFDLPTSELIDVLLKIMPQNKILKLIDDNAMVKFLQSDKVDKNELYKLIQSMPQHVLAQILEASTGKVAGNKQHSQLLDEIGALRKDKLVDGLGVLSRDDMLKLVGELTQKDKTLFQEFPTYSFVKPLESCTKPQIIEGMLALEPERIINMLGELPQKLMAQVVTLLDTEKLADQLLKYQQNLLTEIIAA